MRYLCTSCNFIFDEGIGDQDSGIEAWTSFDDLGDYFKCPVCEDSADAFHEIKEEVNYIDNHHTRDPMEVDHFIETERIWDKLKVTIWNGIHPMWESHSISSISLFDEYSDLVEEIFLPMDEEAIAEFDFDDLGEYEIRCRCTLHWVWGKKFQE